MVAQWRRLLDERQEYLGLLREVAECNVDGLDEETDVLLVTIDRRTWEKVIAIPAETYITMPADVFLELIGDGATW